MKKSTLLTLLALVIGLQLAIPGGMILRREYVLSHGRAFKFRVDPVDPHDPFRGRYVALRFAQNSVAIPPGLTIRRNQTVHVLLGEDDNGFAIFTGLQLTRPKSDPYLTTRVNSAYSGNAILRLPFDRFYMDEKSAPTAEIVARNSLADTNRPTYAEVRISRGFAVLADLYVADRPIREVLAAP